MALLIFDQLLVEFGGVSLVIHPQKNVDDKKDQGDRKCERNIQ